MLSFKGATEDLQDSRFHKYSIIASFEVGSTGGSGFSLLPNLRTSPVECLKHDKYTLENCRWSHLFDKKIICQIGVIGPL